jgi:hypothetical protein
VEAVEHERVAVEGARVHRDAPRRLVLGDPQLPLLLGVRVCRGRLLLLPLVRAAARLLLFPGVTLAPRLEAVGLVPAERVPREGVEALMNGDERWDGVEDGAGGVQARARGDNAGGVLARPWAAAAASSDAPVSTLSE